MRHNCFKQTSAKKSKHGQTKQDVRNKTYIGIIQHPSILISSFHFSGDDLHL